MNPVLIEKMHGQRSPEVFRTGGRGKDGKPVLLRLHLKRNSTGPQLPLSQLNHPENTMLSEEREETEE